jgi:hypothetical protein
LGEGTSYLLCAFILAEFQRAALSRVDLPDSQRRPFSLLCDEFVNYTTDTIRQILAESRKFGLELGLAAQEVKGQLKTEALQSAVLNTVGNILAFRLGYEDASTLVKDVFTPEIDEQVKEIRPRYQKVGNADIRFDDKIYRSLEEIWELEKRKLTQLPDRTLWWKQRGQPGTHRIQTLSVADIEDLPNRDRLPEALKRQELAAFRLAGRPKTFDSQRQYVWRRRNGQTGQSSNGQETLSVWGY